MSIVIKMGDPIVKDSHLQRAVNYIMQEQKTQGRFYSNSGFSPDEIIETFFLTKKIHPSHGKRQGYHWKFSFSKDETISHDDALLFIQDWVNEYLGDEYDYVVAEHSDRELTHMHLVFNATRRGGGKFRYENEDWEKIIKPLTNRICDMYQTGHLKEKEKELDYSPQKDWKSEVEKDIDRCIKKSKSYEDFKRLLQKDFHYSIREGVSKDHGIYLALKPPGKAKAVRTYKLSPGYMPEDIEQRIKEKTVRSKERESPNRADQPTRKNETKKIFLVIIRSADGSMRTGSLKRAYMPYKNLSPYQKYFVRRMLAARRLYHRTGSTLKEHEQSVRAIRRMMNEVSELYRYNIRSVPDLTEKISTLESQIAAASQSMSGRLSPEKKEAMEKEIRFLKADLAECKKIKKQNIPAPSEQKPERKEQKNERTK